MDSPLRWLGWRATTSYRVRYPSVSTAIPIVRCYNWTIIVLPERIHLILPEFFVPCVNPNPLTPLIVSEPYLRLLQKNNLYKHIFGSDLTFLPSGILQDKINRVWRRRGMSSSCLWRELDYVSGSPRLVPLWSGATRWVWRTQLFRNTFDGGIHTSSRSNSEAFADPSDCYRTLDSDSFHNCSVFMAMINVPDSLQCQDQNSTTRWPLCPWMIWPP